MCSGCLAQDVREARSQDNSDSCVIALSWEKTHFALFPFFLTCPGVSGQVWIFWDRREFHSQVTGHRWTVPNHPSGLLTKTSRMKIASKKNNNNNNTIWGGSVLTGEEPPPHSGELKHALSQAGGPTQSQLSRPMSSGHHISMEHRQRRKQLNSDTNASNKKYLKEIQEKRKEETVSSEKVKNEKH